MKTLDPVPIISYTLIFNMLSIFFMPRSIPFCLYLAVGVVPSNLYRGTEPYHASEVIAALFGLFAMPFLMAYFIMFLIDACRKELSPETRALGIRILEYLFRSLAVLFAVGLALLSVFVIVRSQVR